jgi:selenoprotein W-related protein
MPGNDPSKSIVTIEYCTQCRWMLRAAWTAQELLTTFEGDLHEVALRPATGGVFRVTVNATVIWDRHLQRGFPQPKELKQRLRDVVAPGRSLGHSDSPVSTQADETVDPVL